VPLGSVVFRSVFRPLLLVFGVKVPGANVFALSLRSLVSRTVPLGAVGFLAGSLIVGIGGGVDLLARALGAALSLRALVSWPVPLGAVVFWSVLWPLLIGIGG